MFSSRFVAELRGIFQAQHHILDRLEDQLDSIETQAKQLSDQQSQIAELEALMDEIESQAHLFHEEDARYFDTEEIQNLYHERKQKVAQSLTKIGYSDWKSFVSQCQRYALSHDRNPFQPYEAFLSEEDWQQLNDSSYDAQYRWDKWDVAMVGTASVLAALTDFFLVALPKGMTYAGVDQHKFASPLTGWLKQQGQEGFWADFCTKMEKLCKVSFDRQDAYFGDSLERINGMYPRSHRYQSLGHDPVLGLVFGVLDILRGNISAFAYDKTTGVHSFVVGKVLDADPISIQGIIEAFLKWFGHMISDVTTNMGLPAPFLTALQGLNIGSFGPKGRSVAEIGRWMYLSGYDLRHFFVSGITPGTIELILRAYIMLRHYHEHGETKFVLADNPKYRSMLLVAHSLAAAANAGKVALMQGNPLAINQAQWMAWMRYMLPSMKYWIFDKQRLKMEYLHKTSAAEWAEIEKMSQQTMEWVAKEELELITLGEAPA